MPRRLQPVASGRKPNPRKLKKLDGLRQEVNALPEPQKISLIAPAPYQVEKHMNPNILDVLGAKQTMYELIEAPSEAVQLAFADLMKVLTARRPSCAKALSD